MIINLKIGKEMHHTKIEVPLDDDFRVFAQVDGWVKISYQYYLTLSWSCLIHMLNLYLKKV